MNVTQIVTLDKKVPGDRIGKLPLDIMREVDDGLSLALSAWLA